MRLDEATVWNPSFDVSTTAVTLPPFKSAATSMSVNIAGSVQFQGGLR